MSKIITFYNNMFDNYNININKYNDDDINGFSNKN